MDDFLVFDLETQRAAQDVGGWGNIPEMKMSVGVVWDSRKNDFFVYLENQILELIKHLKSGPVVIGYNHIYFDYPVLSGYYTGEERKTVLDELIATKNLDLLVRMKQTLGHRLKLDSLVRPTLSVGKSADGLLALQWYKEYIQEGDRSKLQLIIDYCKQDVAVTRDLYLHGLKNKSVYYDSKTGGIKKVAVDWSKPLEQEKPKEDDSEQLGF
ncbi:MAG: DEAD/DEAH box helicase domain-containing protein [bacterium]|jgi:DEAD/DEAH box helicase domain-containing protein